jgi:hypothetical protein
MACAVRRRYVRKDVLTENRPGAPGIPAIIRVGPFLTQAVWKLESLSAMQKVVLPAGQKAFHHADRAVGIAHRKNNVLFISSACDFSHGLDPKAT